MAVNETAWLDLIKNTALTMLGSLRYEIIRYILIHGAYPRLSNPVTFNEKLLHRKLYDRNPIYVRLADKHQVREFVREKIGNKFLSTIYFAGSDPKTINFESLPGKFVVKATHGSGPHFIRMIEDKQTLTPESLQEICSRLMVKPYGHITNEWWYQNIRPQILLEEFLQDQETGVPLDYKFLVFHGEVKLISVDYARFSNHTRTFYNPDWQPQELTYKYKQPKGPVSKRPKMLPEMIEISQTLAKDFGFIRVDLYCINDSRIIFGELTLAPGAGSNRFSPKEWDLTLGELW